MRFYSSPSLIITICVTVICASFSPAQAQSDSQLRRQNDELRQRVQDMTEQLRAANQRIAELEKTIAQLREELAKAGSQRTETPPPQEKVTIDESTPDASPRALLRHLQEDYEATLGDMDRGSTGDRTRTAFVRALERWRNRVNRELRTQIEWHVKIIEAARVSRGVQLRLVAIDPETQVELGDPFYGALRNSSVIRRLEVFDEKGQLDHLVLRGILEPAVDINPARDEQGTFNSPPFIGPFAEFGMRVQIDTLLPPEEVEDETDADKRG